VSSPATKLLRFPTTSRKVCTTKSTAHETSCCSEYRFVISAIRLGLSHSSRGCSGSGIRVAAPRETSFKLQSNAKSTQQPCEAYHPNSVLASSITSLVGLLHPILVRAKHSESTRIALKVAKQQSRTIGLPKFASSAHLPVCPVGSESSVQNCHGRLQQHIPSALFPISFCEKLDEQLVI